MRFKTVSTAVTLQTQGDAGPEPALATPKDISDAIHSFANGLQDIAMNALAGVGNEDPAQSARLRDAEAVNTRIAELCKWEPRRAFAISSSSGVCPVFDPEPHSSTWISFAVTARRIRRQYFLEGDQEIGQTP